MLILHKPNNAHLLYFLPYKTKQFFFLLIKLSIVVGAFYFIYNKLASNSALGFSTFIKFLLKNNVLSLKHISFLLILTSLNWFFEIVKWQTLVSSFKKINFKNALEQSLGALTASLFTPNRIGEYGAKAIYFKPMFRKKVLLTNLLGNIMQMSITLIMGIIGLSIFISSFNIPINFYKITKVLTLTLMIIFLVVLSLKGDFSIKGYSLKKLMLTILNFNKKTLTLGIFYSLLRYLIFSFQFYFILKTLGANCNYLETMYAITSMYLLSSIIPSIFIFDVIIKGSVALYLFSFLGINELTILSTVTLMWVLNFMLPSVFGSIYVLNFNFENNIE